MPLSPDVVIEIDDLLKIIKKWKEIGWPDQFILEQIISTFRYKQGHHEECPNMHDSAIELLDLIKEHVHYPM